MSVTLKKLRSPRLSIEPADRDDMDMIADFIRSTADWYRPFLDEKDMAEHEAALLAALESQGLQPAGEPVLAQYNPPWTLPFLRRNEILVPVR